MQSIQIKPYLRKVHFYETDQMGIVHHSNYIRWLEESRIDFMEQIGYGYTRVSGLGIDFAVLGVNVDYKQSNVSHLILCLILSIYYTSIMFCISLTINILRFPYFQHACL